MRTAGYQRWSALLFSLTVHTAMAAEPMAFKKDFSLKISWFNYITAIIALLGLVFFIVKKQRTLSAKESVCRLIEKKHLAGKTVVYVIDCYQQRFLLADNQQSLTLHPLMTEDADEPK